MASAATLRRCALPAAAALAAQQQHARTEGLLQWRSSRVAPQSVDGRPVADVREGGGAVSRLYGRKALLRIKRSPLLILAQAANAQRGHVFSLPPLPS